MKRRVALAQRAVATLASVLQEPKSPLVRDRNLTVHTHNEPLAEEIFGRLPRYAELLSTWAEALAARAGA